MFALSRRLSRKFSRTLGIFGGHGFSKGNTVRLELCDFALLGRVSRAKAMTRGTGIRLSSSSSEILWKACYIRHITMQWVFSFKFFTFSFKFLSPFGWTQKVCVCVGGGIHNTTASTSHFQIASTSKRSCIFFTSVVLTKLLFAGIFFKFCEFKIYFLSFFIYGKSNGTRFDLEWHSEVKTKANQIFESLYLAKEQC